MKRETLKPSKEKLNKIEEEYLKNIEEYSLEKKNILKEIEENYSKNKKEIENKEYTMLEYFVNEMREYEILNNDETKLLFEIYKKTHNKKVKEKLINHNLRLVVDIASNYKKGYNDTYFLDLIQEGVFGLIRAVEKYSAKKNTKFSTYAYIWIKSSIERYVFTQSKIIKIPVHYNEIKTKVKKFKESFIIQNNREPKKEEIIKFVKENTKFRDYNSLFNDFEFLEITPEIIKENKKNFKSKEDTHKEIEKKEQKDSFLKVLKEILTPVEYTVIVEKYGILTNEKCKNDLLLKKIKNIKKKKYRIFKNEMATKIDIELIRKKERSALKKIKRNKKKFNFINF